MKEVWESIKHNLTDCLTNPDKPASRTNREIVYGALACAAVGMVLGMLLSPRKNMPICCHNGCHNGNGGTQQEEE